MPEKISVMIVEDERIILDDILSMIDWTAEGFEVVATATNGKLGRLAHEKLHPQLIITDIQMPVVDGLSMMRQLRHEDNTVSFLILSSYSEFEYAKEAVRLGTDSYLLKTELSSELLRETLAPIREKILSRQAMHRLAAQHRLFDLVSASVEPGDSAPPTGEDISASLTAYLELNSDSDECHKQLHRVISECYSVLGILDRYTPCNSTCRADLEQWLLSEYHKLRGLYDSIYIKKLSPVIINACQYIQANYPDHQLKISAVSDHVGLSAGRLSVLFKQEAGKTVNDYITELRISEAKRLLRSGRYKVYEVSELVGYKTSQYFSQIFFQYTGAYPTAYLRGEQA